MRFDHVAHGINVDTKILANEDVAEAADLRPGDLRVCLGDLHREMVCGFSDDLQVPLDRIFGHLNQIRVAAHECADIPSTVDRFEDVSDALLNVPTHSVTASARADSEIGRLSSCTGNMSISLPFRAVPRADEPKRRGFVAAYLDRSARKSSLRASRSPRRASVSGVAAVLDMPQEYRQA